MRISDWSSDVCSSDLLHDGAIGETALRQMRGTGAHVRQPAPDLRIDRGSCGRRVGQGEGGKIRDRPADLQQLARKAKQDRKSVVQGKSGSERVDIGGRRIIKKKTKETKNEQKN